MSLHGLSSQTLAGVMWECKKQTWGHEKVGSGAWALWKSCSILEAHCVYLNREAGLLHTAGKGDETANMQIHKEP